MARGWESKAVEDQMNEADARPQRVVSTYDPSPAVRARRERLETLRLSHTRALEQLKRATTPAHRAMLERAINALEEEMKGLS
jgi:hypothetical protein